MYLNKKSTTRHRIYEIFFFLNQHMGLGAQVYEQVSMFRHWKWIIGEATHEHLEVKTELADVSPECE